MRDTEARRSYDKRRDADSPTRKLYDTAAWRRLRKDHLASEPLCRMCLARGILNAGHLTSSGAPQPDARRHFLVCDHVIPHRGDVEKFWAGPFQSLCPDHHDRQKQAEDNRGFSVEVDLDGWPIDQRHPANRRPG